MQNNNTEIEIKLSCPQNFNDIFAKNLNNFGTFEVIKNEQINCLNTYFDTKKFDLKQQKTALRFRKMHNIKSNQNNYFLTIKSSNLIDNQRGLSNRKEFNLKVFTENINLQNHNDFLAKYIPNFSQVIPNLQAMFYTNFLRNTYLINYETLQIEIAIDNGKIYSDLITTKIYEISEIEMEIIKGDNVDLLNKFADNLSNYFAQNNTFLLLWAIACRNTKLQMQIYENNDPLVFVFSCLSVIWVDSSGMNVPPVSL